MNFEQQHELIPMGLGEMLRCAREKKHWTLEAAAQVIKVRAEILTSIETGETQHIPPVYLKGYVRAYARELGVPLKAIEQHLLRAQGSEPVVQSIFKDGLRRNPIDRWFKATSYVLASAVVIALVWQFTTEAVRFSQGEPVLKSSRSGDTQSLPSQLEGQNTAAGSAQEFESKPASANTHLRASIASLSIPDDRNSTSSPLIAEGAWAAVGNRAAANYSQDSDPPRLTGLEIVTSADSWVEILDRNGNKIEMDLLRAGSKRTYSGGGPFRVLLGRASSVEVFHNGEKINLAPYTRGNVARLTLGGVEDVPEPTAISDSESSATDLSPPDQG